MLDHHALLRLENLTITRSSQLIVRNVSLSVARKRIHALVGANGSGKSTLAHALMGCEGYAVTQGRVWLDGEDITRFDITTRARRGLTLAMQEPARFEGLRVGRYLALGMVEADQETICDALLQVGLAPDAYGDRMLDEGLSGGERKRIELAAVLCMRPKVVVLDECDSGIDSLSVPTVARAIKRLAQHGTAVLLISHSAELAHVADAASLLVNGAIVQTGSVRQISAQYARLSQRDEAFQPKLAVRP